MPAGGARVCLPPPGTGRPAAPETRRRRCRVRRRPGDLALSRWFLRSCDTLLGWLRKLGFASPEVVDVNITSTDEQRSTDWMRFHSLADFLDPEDHGKTIEGYPAPRRAIVTALAPAR